jgi:hypothetical protein
MQFYSAKKQAILGQKIITMHCILVKHFANNLASIIISSEVLRKGQKVRGMQREEE